MAGGEHELYTLGEVAGIFAVSYKTVLRWVTSGTLPTMRTPGGHHRVRREVVEELLERG
jgi:excisionase family DNA binding protein